MDKIKEKLTAAGGLSQEVEIELHPFWKHCVLAVENLEIRGALVTYLEDVAPIEFYVRPASSTGAHHPAWQNKPAGIIRNTVECCLLIPGMMGAFPELSGPPPETAPDPLARDIITAATVLSDSQKGGKPWGAATDRNHGAIAAEDFQRVAERLRLNPAVTSRIVEATRWHLGRFTPGWTPEVVFSPETKLTHLLDMFFACKALEELYWPRLAIV